MSNYNHRVKVMSDNWQVCLRRVAAHMSCQSHLELHCWQLSPSIRWHLQQSTPPAHSHSCQSPCWAMSVCLCTFRVCFPKKKNNWKKVLLSGEKGNDTEMMRIKLSCRWQSSWQIKPCSADISGLCQMWQLNFFTTSIKLTFYSRFFLERNRNEGVWIEVSKSQCNAMFNANSHHKT